MSTHYTFLVGIAGANGRLTGDFLPPLNRESIFLRTQYADGPTQQQAEDEAILKVTLYMIELLAALAVQNDPSKDLVVETKRLLDRYTPNFSS